MSALAHYPACEPLFVKRDGTVVLFRTSLARIVSGAYRASSLANIAL
jgi:hypothetical protein